MLDVCVRVELVLLMLLPDVLPFCVVVRRINIKFVMFFVLSLWVSIVLSCVL